MMSLLGHRQPKRHEVAGGDDRAAGDMVGSEAWPIHVKDVPRINIEAALARLDGGAEARAKLEYVVGWLRDDSRYAAVPLRSANRAPTTKMPQAQIDTLEQYGVVVRVAREKVRGWVKMFTVPEAAKRRHRPIKHTVDANDALGVDSTMPLRFPSKHEICDLVHQGQCFIALDFAAYYDQFVYDPHVATRFCFRMPTAAGTVYYRLGTLAMGQRQAVEVAACMTRWLLDFPKTSRTLDIIDNVIFVGARGDVVRDAREFVRRVAVAGGMLNEDTSDIEALVKTEGDWGGIHLDFIAHTSCLLAKTIEKTTLSWAHRGEWTWRTFASHLGLLFWSWQIIDLPMPEFYPLLRFMSFMGQLLTRDESLWNTPAKIWPSAWPSLLRWTRLVEANAPRVVPCVLPPEWLVCTDASGDGWGYFAVCNDTGAVRAYGARWNDGFRRLYGDRLGVSTFTEPQAVVNSLCHLLKLEDRVRRVRIFTDNTVAQASFQRGYNSHSYYINECASKLRSTFGHEFQFVFEYIPGELNPADPWSRGKYVGVFACDASDAEHGVRGAEIRRMAGFGSAVPQGR